MIIFSPSLNVGGGEKIAREIANGINGSLLICFYGETDSSNARFILKKKIPKSKIVRCIDILYIFIWIVFYLMIHKPKYVLTHIHFVSLIVYLASKFSFQKGLVQDSVVHGRIKCEENKSSYYFNLLCTAYKNSRYCICVSNSMVDELHDQGIMNTRVILNSINKSHIQNDLTTKVNEVENENENVNLKGIFIGRLEEVKNLASLLFSLPDNIQIDIYGEGSNELSLKKIVAEHNLNVSFMGFNKDVRRLIKKYDFLINPSKSETFSLVLLEAIMESTPIITSNCKFGPMDLFDIDRNIYFNIKDYYKIGDLGLVFNLNDEYSLKSALDYFSTHHKDFYVTDVTRSMYAERYSMETMINSYKELML